MIVNVTKIDGYEAYRATSPDAPGISAFGPTADAAMTALLEMLSYRSER